MFSYNPVVWVQLPQHRLVAAALLSDYTCSKAYAERCILWRLFNNLIVVVV